MLDRAAVARVVNQHGAAVRVVIAAHKGSSPREAGTAMLVWADGQGGTIGGGALEWQAIQQAQEMLNNRPSVDPARQSGSTGDARPLGQALPVSPTVHGTAPRTQRLPLGPALGQCCGGAVTLVYELIDTAALATIPESGLYARRIEGGADLPLPIARALRQARGVGSIATLWKAGWLAEPVVLPSRSLWVWGAGHVGRAIVATLAPFPDFAITWVDSAPDRFPETIPDGVCPRHAANPAELVAQAPVLAEHLILTYSHALDLALCHGVLAHGFAHLGLIGSASKSARFRSRLRALGHTDAQIARICCPIGDPSLGKHPQAIALGVGAALLKNPPDLRQAFQPQTESAG